MARAAAQAAALAELKANRASGRTRMSTYEIKDAQSVYDEVDEEEYKTIVRTRLDRDDFVVEDNGEGYADDGREDWAKEDRPLQESDGENEQPLRGKAAKRKREEDRLKKEKTNTGINQYFAMASSVPAKTRPVTTADDAAFMADLLGEVDVTVSTRRYVNAIKPVKSESRRKTRVLSPPVLDERQGNKMNGGMAFAAASIPSPAEGISEPEIEDSILMDLDNAFEDTVHMPSSPVMRAAIRRSQVAMKIEDDDDEDGMEVAQAVRYSGIQATNINVSGSRPVSKVERTIKVETNDYPTPVSSSPTRPPADIYDSSTLDEITSNLNVQCSPATEAASYGKLDHRDATESDGSLNFFWLDYAELNGSLLLFGKVKNKRTGSFVSCFVKVDNILRKLYFLPRQYRLQHGQNTTEEVEMGSVYQEVDTMMTKFKVQMHKMKPCTRKYAFELANIPKEADYLKLLYPYDKPPLPQGSSGETFSHVFGTNTSIFEQFVLWKDIMGPCWLKIEEADFNAVNNASWCKLELRAGKPNLISVLKDADMEAPTLTLMSIAFRTTMNAKENKQEIIMVSARIYENVSLTDTTPAEKLPCKTLTIIRSSREGFPTGFALDVEKHVGAIKMEKTELGLLSLFLGHLQRIDPDVLLGHKLEDVDYAVLLSRLKDRKVPGWHRIGRLRRSDWPKNMGRGGGSFFVERQLIAGRLLCDLANDQGKSLMTKCQSWSLSEMCELVLATGNARREIDNDVALKTWATERKGLMNYVKHCEADTYFIAAIALKLQMLPLTMELTRLAGNSWARTLTGTRAERNEYILLHEFTRKKYICPDKTWNKGKEPVADETVDGEENSDTKKKDKFKGGLVFEPEKGLYDRIVLVMDFNSLYPSIIQEYNICFTTVDRSSTSEDDDRVSEVPEAQGQGILPKLIATLVSRRREVKKLMKTKNVTHEQIATWDTKQTALKLTANSMYGCLGYTRSRFYARPLAMLTTHKGREILQSTKELAEGNQLRVIYGDTDSVMINTNLDNIEDALKVGNDFKRAVNERYRLLEIDIDNTFRRLLLHAKKKYAAINMVEIDGKYVEKLEVKGLDMRRREFCALSKETSSRLLNFLLSGDEPETVIEQIHDYLRELAVSMREYKVPAQKYIIFTQLSKDPKDYANSKSMPSVQVALRMLAKGKTVRAKDVISYIFTGTNGNSAESASANAMPPDEVLRVDSELKPDIDYYLHKQILPPVERLCAPIALTNISRLAECLGLDTSKYRVSGATGAHAGTQEEMIQPLDSQVSDAVRFANCAPLQLRCLAAGCRKVFEFRSLVDDARAVGHSGWQCPAAECSHGLPNLAVVAQLEHQIRTLLQKYYEGWLVCDDPSCGNKTRQMSVYGHRCLGPRGHGSGCLGRMGWMTGEKAIWNQLVYWERSMDASRAKERLKSEAGQAKVKSEGESAATAEQIAVLAELNRERFETCRMVVKGYLDKSGRQWVDMGSLFSFVR